MTLRRHAAAAIVVFIGCSCRRESPSQELRPQVPPPPAPIAASDPIGSNRPPPLSPTEDELLRLGKFGGSLRAPANGTVEASVEIDGNSRIYGHVFVDSSVRYTIVGPSGIEIPLLRRLSGEMEGGATIEEFELDDPPVGTATIRVEGGPKGGALHYGLYFVNGRRLDVCAEPFSVAPGGRLTITARLVDAEGAALRGRDEVYEGTVVLDYETTRKIELRDDGRHADGEVGDGMFGAFFDDTLVEGRAEVHIRGAVQFEGYRTVRMENRHFIVRPTGATFVGDLSERGVDEDGDGLFDELEFSQQLSFSKPGDYMLFGNLMDAQGELITALRWSGDVPEGVEFKIVTARVPGEDLVRHGEEGPWTVTDRRIIAEDAGSLTIAEAPDHLTEAISLARFEPPAPPTISAVQGDSNVEDPSAGFWATLFGTGLSEVESVLIDGRETKFQPRDDGAVGIFVPPTRRERPEGQHPMVTVSVEVRTRWGSASDPHGVRYEW